MGEKLWPNPRNPGGPKPATFDFLGFTHICNGGFSPVPFQGQHVKRRLPEQRLDQALALLSEEASKTRKNELRGIFRLYEGNAVVDFAFVLRYGVTDVNVDGFLFAGEEIPLDWRQ